MLQWSERQVHDTVAAIARQPVYGGGTRRSLLSRVTRYLFDRLEDLFRAVGGSLNAKLVIVAAVLAIVLVIVARAVTDRQLAERRRLTSRARMRSGERANYWSEADAAAQAGRFTDACHLLHAAVLDALSRTGVVKWHASKTNGDYARELRRAGSPHHATFRAFAAEFERAVFGLREPTAGDYARLRLTAEHVLRERAAA